MNQKLIVNTIANITEHLASMQFALAGLTAIVESRLPNLTPEEKDTLQKGIEKQKVDSEALRLKAIALKEAAGKL